MQQKLAGLSREEPAVTACYRVHHKAGHYLWIETVARALYAGDSNTLTGILTSSRDISERKRAEEALHRREQEFRALAENNPDVISRLDRNMRVLYLYSAFQKTTGSDPWTIIGKSMLAMSRYEHDQAVRWQEGFRRISDNSPNCL